jgi:hypothetical protein
MALQTVIELVLAVGAVLLLIRDLRRAWSDRLRRPITLLMAAVIAGLVVGVTGGRPHPSAWWLLLPGAILAWEVVRGWRLAPRCHVWEAGIGALAAGLTLAAVGLGLGGRSSGAVPLVLAAGAFGAGVGLLLRSRRQESRPGRVGDASHFERRLARRPGG